MLRLQRRCSGLNANPAATHPPINATPPTGVTSPTSRGAPSASAYRLPENSRIPTANSPIATPRARPDGNPITAPNSASACQKWYSTPVCQISSPWSSITPRSACAPKAPRTTAKADEKGLGAADILSHEVRSLGSRCLKAGTGGVSLAGYVAECRMKPSFSRRALWPLWTLTPLAWGGACQREPQPQWKLTDVSGHLPD